MRGAQALVRALAKRQGRELATLVIGIRHSQGTDAKVFDKFIKSLEIDGD